MDAINRNVGETKYSVKARIYQHRKPSTNEAQNSAIYLHIRDSKHTMNFEDLVILDKEEHYHKHGIEEAIWERIEEWSGASLNKQGGLRYSLSHVWDRALCEVNSHLSHDQHFHESDAY